VAEESSPSVGEPRVEEAPQTAEASRISEPIVPLDFWASTNALPKERYMMAAFVIQEIETGIRSRMASEYASRYRAFKKQ